MAWIDSSTSRGENGPSDIPKRDPNGLLKTHAKGHKKKEKMEDEVKTKITF
jgi:hypothetical protein